MNAPQGSNAKYGDKDYN